MSAKAGKMFSGFLYKYDCYRKNSDIAVMAGSLGNLIEPAF